MGEDPPEVVDEVRLPRGADVLEDGGGAGVEVLIREDGEDRAELLHGALLRAVTS
jgi:hypothetical protein